MTKLVALYSIFNSRDLLYDSMTSIGPLVDEIRIYDGRYTEYRCACNLEHDNSCDGTLAEVKQWVNDQVDFPTVITCKLPAMPEMAKRNKMFDGLEMGDVAFIIDDDELFFGYPRPVKDFVATLPAKVAYIDFLFAGAGHGSGVPIPLARLFVKTPGLRYEKSYYNVVDDAGLVVNMREDNRNVPYGRRAGGRFYIHPSARIVELWEGYRSKKRDKARADYNLLISKRDWQ